MAMAFNENDELWKQCASWLTRWEMLREDHKVNRPEASITDLANIIRDGVLLCKLLNKIDPGCIDMKNVNLKPTMAQFLCLQNIKLFLNACTVSFGLKQNDLFEASMLFDLTNFHKVLCTLSKLSSMPKALKGNIPGFSEKVKTKEEDMIYQSLKDVEMPRRSREVATLDPTSEEIYQDLCDIRKRVEHQPTLEKRDFVIRELKDTEKNYVEVLGNLKKCYMKPLKEYMDEKKHEIVFCCINELHEIHAALFNELMIMEQDTTLKLSSIFLRWKARFLIYGKYCANLTRATTVLQELCDDDENFNELVVRQEKEVNNGKFKLRDILSVPMQRILKYHLLLQKLIENTDRNHTEYLELTRAREAMLDVATYINEAARDSEALEVINKIQENLVDIAAEEDFKLSSYGRLLRDSEIRIKDHRDPKIKQRYVFIFEKMILICKPIKGGQFQYRDLLNIKDYQVDSNSRYVLGKEARFVCQFHLVKYNNDSVFTLYVKSKELKEQLIRSINIARELLIPLKQPTTHDFELSTFDQSNWQCFYCSKLLKGLISQGYQCLKCNMVVHKTCIPNSGRCGNTTKQELVNGVDSDPISSKLWFVGEMDRGTAEAKIQYRDNGTYLVRVRKQCDDDNKYAVTLKTDNSIKHMKICCSQEEPKKYFLSRSKYFNSVEELILNYQNHTLKENFEKLDDNTKLLWPFRQIKAVVINSFDAQSDNQLSLIEGCTIKVIAKEGYKEGWWKGRTQTNEVGYFPKEHVREEGIE